MDVVVFVILENHVIMGSANIGLTRIQKENFLFCLNNILIVKRFSCQAIGKSSGGQHVSLCNQQMSSIEEVSTTQHQRQSIPESSAIINPLHSSSSTGLAFCFCDESFK